MSSPPTAPTPSAHHLTKSQSQRSHTQQPRPTPGTNPSTPAPAATPGQHTTPASTAPFLSPSLSRVNNLAGKSTVGGKTVAGKSLAGKGVPNYVSPAAHGSSPAAVGMVATQSLNGGLGTTFDSPGHAALAGVGMEASSSGAAMGLSMSNMGLGMHGVGGNLSHMGMMAGLSQGMLGASSMGIGAQSKLDDAERRRRLESVLSILGEGTGRISQEGLERLARRMGLEMFEEERDGGRGMMIAGLSMFAVEVLFRPASSPVVAETTFQFHGVNDETIADFSPAAAILREDLSPPKGTSTINAKLDSFAKNLEKISQLERLSGKGANCFEAISGIHRSLKKLYEHEVKLAEIVRNNKENAPPDVQVTCKKSGRPRMNVRKTVGLSIEYWRDQHHLSRPRLGSGATHSNEDEPMPDAPTSSSSQQNPDPDSDTHPYTLHVDIQPCPSSLYTPIRTSAAWISDSITKPPDPPTEQSHNTLNSEDAQQINWQEPPPLTLANPSEPPPDARFIAQLDPPLTLPLTIAAQILASVDTNLDLTQEEQQTFETLVLPNHPGVAQRGSPSEPVASSKSVLTFNENGEEEGEETWESRVYFPRPELAKTLYEVPFAHPRQLVQLLPCLRQYALLAKLLSSAVAESLAGGGDGEGGDGVAASTTQSTQDELSAFLAATPAPDEPDQPDSSARKERQHPRTIDTTLRLTPTPQLTTIFPTARGLLTAHISIDLNAEIGVTCAGDAVDSLLKDLADEERAARKERMEGAMAQALDRVEDLVFWGEWVREKFRG